MGQPVVGYRYRVSGHLVFTDGPGLFLLFLTITFFQPRRTSKDSIQGQPIADLLVDDKDAFQRAVETMKSDDSRSFKLRFTVAMGSMSKLSREASAISASPAESEVEAFQMDETPEQQQQTTLTLEGQGILIYDRATGEPSHVSLPDPGAL